MSNDELVNALRDLRLQRQQSEERKIDLLRQLKAEADVWHGLDKQYQTLFQDLENRIKPPKNPNELHDISVDLLKQINK